MVTKGGHDEALNRRPEKQLSVDVDLVIIGGKFTPLPVLNLANKLLTFVSPDQPVFCQLFLRGR